jgi:TRAP transporter 4TM/12TM fusion protein
MSTSLSTSEQPIGDSRVRVLHGTSARAVFLFCVLWSLFQVYVASSIPFWLSSLTGISLVFNNQEVRQLHLAFSLVLAMLLRPLVKNSTQRIPLYDILLALLGASSCLYLFVLKDSIADRAGLPTTSDLIISMIGLCCLGLAVYRTLGLPLLVVAGVFLSYVFFGDKSFIPEVIQWKGASLNKALWHFWMQTEGVFGVALGVSSSMIFLFVLFGALLERAGAGQYFIQLAFALLGHFRGGPAKAAVVASGLSGLYSGSSIANVVTTGTFTIPLMKKTGFTPEKAGAVEVASSTNGQLTPPVMGAAAFLIAEFTGTPYLSLIRHAFLPALVSYIALLYIVHLEALKLGLEGRPRPPIQTTLLQRVAGVLVGFVGMGLLSIVVYFGFGWLKDVLPELTLGAAALLVAGFYLFLVRLASKLPDLDQSGEVIDLENLPPAGTIALTGLHYLLPIVVLLWCVLIERLSPALSAFWAMIVMATVLVTQHPLKAWFRGEGQWSERFQQGMQDLWRGLANGAENMIGIGVATGVAGVIIGTVSLTGAHQVIGEFVEMLSGGSLILMLLLVAVMSLLLGMGLPTTANYIVVSSLMAPVIVSLGSQNGLIVPLVAVHLFVFYFGILADDTPPVGLAAFAAAAISQGDPIKTGIQGFTYDIRTALLPFLFLFNTELLLIDVSWFKGIFVFLVAASAMMLFAAATQGYWLVRCHWWEIIVLLLVAFTLFRPGYWLDQWQEPWQRYAGSALMEQLEQKGRDLTVRLDVEGPDFDRPEELNSLTILLELKADQSLQQALDENGILIQVDAENVILEEPMPGSTYFQPFQRFDFYMDDSVRLIAVLEPQTNRFAKEWFYLPALALLALVWFTQRRRSPLAPA